MNWRTAWVIGALSVLAAVTSACGDDEEEGRTNTAGSGGASGGTGGTAGAGGSAGSAGQPALSLSLPQSIDGALLANPSVYSVIPLHVLTTGQPDSVSVEVDGKTTIASDSDGDGEFVAQLDIGGLDEGTRTLTARAERGGSAPVDVQATLSLRKSGVQLTDVTKVGMAATPCLHRVGGQLWLSWRDRSQTQAGIYLERLDGAAVPQGTPITLIPASEDALYARVAFGSSSIGILYQTLGNPYVDHFTVVDPSGKQIVAPIDLDPASSFGLTGGDIAFDGSGWVFVWRTTDGTTQDLRWARVEESSGTLTGPVVVAQSGNDDPNGKFPGFVPVGVRALGDKSLVSFVRERWDSLLAMAIPKSQLALVQSDGTVSWTEYAGNEGDWTFHHEARVYRAHDTLVPIWSAVDLTSTATNPPNLFFATQTDAQAALDPNRGAGTQMFDAPDDRGDPFLVEHSEHFGVLAWLDHRKYTLEPQVGGIELYVAPVSSELVTLAPTVFPHARFIAGTSEVNAVTAGTNVVLTWIDERHGQGVLDPKPEVWVETAWF
jgi:hypothetical protein